MAYYSEADCSLEIKLHNPILDSLLGTNFGEDQFVKINTPLI